MSKNVVQLRSPFAASRLATAAVLFMVSLLLMRTVQGQSGQVKGDYDLAIKTVVELGGHLRYADQFTTVKDGRYLDPIQDPLDEYGDMRCPPIAGSPQRGGAGKLTTNKGPRQVVQIDLSGTKPTDEELAKLATFSQLRVLLLNSATVSDENLRHLAQLSDLEVLDLSSTQVKGAGLRHLAKLTRLKELRLIETGVDDDAIRPLAGLKNLEILSLDGTKVGDRGLELLATNAKLSDLRINDAAATEKGVDRFRHVHPQCGVFHEHWFEPLNSLPEKAAPKDEGKESEDFSADPFEDFKPEKEDSVKSSPAASPKPQPSVSRLFHWDGQIVAECLGPDDEERPDLPPQPSRRFFTIDTRTERAAPLSLPRAGRILYLATAGPSQPLALCLRDGKNVLLLCKEKGVWGDVPLPEQAIRKSMLTVEADASDLVLLTKNEYFWRRKDHWAAGRHAEGDKFLADGSRADSRYVVTGGSLYRAVDCGEFGGGLYRLDLVSGKWSPAKSKATASPVCDVKIDPQGRLWAVEGLSHMSLIEGAVWTCDSNGWKEMVSIDHFRRRKIGWNLGYIDPHGIAFDAAGGIYVMTYAYGICRYEGRCWKPFLHPCSHGIETSLYFASPNLAVVGTDANGIFLCHLDTGVARQVLLLPGDHSRELKKPIP